MGHKKGFRENIRGIFPLNGLAVKLRNPARNTPTSKRSTACPQGIRSILDVSLMPCKPGRRTRMDKLNEKSRARRRGSLLVVARRQVGPAMGPRWSGSRALLCHACVGFRLTGDLWRVPPPGVPIGVDRELSCPLPIVSASVDMGSCWSCFGSAIQDVPA